MSGLFGAAKETNKEFFIFRREVEPLSCLLDHAENRAAILRFVLPLVRDPLDSLSNILTFGHNTHGFSLRGEYSIKNPGPKDPALSHPLRWLQWSFSHAAVCWSNGVVEHCKITNSKHQILGCQVSEVIDLNTEHGNLKPAILVILPSESAPLNPLYNSSSSLVVNPLIYSSHSMGRRYFFLLLHSLQTAATLFLVVLPPRIMGTM